MQVGNVKSIEEKQIFTLSQQKQVLDNQHQKLVLEKEKIVHELDRSSLAFQEIKQKVEEAAKTLSELEKTEATTPE